MNYVSECPQILHTTPHGGRKGLELQICIWSKCTLTYFWLSTTAQLVVLTSIAEHISKIKLVVISLSNLA